MESVNSIIGILAVFIVLPLATAWLIRQWRERRRKNREWSDLVGRPYSGPRSFALQFESTHRDLLDAHATTQISPADRMVLIALGVFWVGCAAVYGPRSVRDGTWWKALLLLGLGTVTIWSNLVKPLAARRRIRQKNAAIQQVTLSVSDSGIHIESPKLGALDRGWEEVCGVEVANKGIALMFVDAANWVPNRAFGSKEERRNFAAYLISKVQDNP